VWCAGGLEGSHNRCMLYVACTAYSMPLQWPCQYQASMYISFTSYNEDHSSTTPCAGMWMLRVLFSGRLLRPGRVWGRPPVLPAPPAVVAGSRTGGCGCRDGGQCWVELHVRVADLRPCKHPRALSGRPDDRGEVRDDHLSSTFLLCALVDHRS
jgi:hypothetical protein